MPKVHARPYSFFNSMDSTGHWWNFISFTIIDLNSKILDSVLNIIKDFFIYFELWKKFAKFTLLPLYYEFYFLFLILYYFLLLFHLKIFFQFRIFLFSGFFIFILYIPSPYLYFTSYSFHSFGIHGSIFKYPFSIFIPNIYSIPAL